MLCGVRVFLLGWGICVREKRRVRLLKVKEVDRGPWVRPAEEKNHIPP